ncbi:unnamed protein product [Caenorhabditis bovis]|uniref:Letm1 RBD domain-containing protein n=2 Tax=Caenorhabditis bovis TaxID=2654633 RepID=A0A8S1FER2_9PELO|nr:unnamed protein product [Caenorhabditis bovis]
MHGVSRLLPRTSRSLIIYRQTSAGPPPADPPKPGGLMHKYEEFIGRWPKALALHRTVMEGSRWCFWDVKTFWRTKRALMNGEKKLTDLNLHELETLVQSGGELLKMLALLVIIQIPGPGDILILMLIFFPRIVLTRHFWSDAQRREFFDRDIKKALTSGEKLVEKIGNPNITVEKQLKKYEEMDPTQKFFMLGLQSMYPLPLARRRLEKRQEALRALDAAMPQYIDELNERQLVFHCYIRKIEIVTKNAEEMKNELRKYLKITSRLSNTAYLYAPIMMRKNS